MKKSVLFFLASMATTYVLAQSGVGIGTDNPQGALHIDGAKDNASNGTPTPAQLANDVIISSNGKIGVGQLPEAGDSAPLQVNGPITVKANAAENPQPGVTYVLASTNGTQQAKWLQNVALSPTVIGVLGSNGSNPSMIPPDGIAKNGYSQGFLPFGNGSWTGIWIKLPPGSWIIQSSVLLYLNGVPTNNQSVWARLSWHSNKDAGVWDPSDVITGRYVSGVVPPTNQFGLAVGTTLISNKTNADKIYYLNMNWSSQSGNLALNWNSVGSSDWSENTIVAYPVISL